MLIAFLVDRLRDDLYSQFYLRLGLLPHFMMHGFLFVLTSFTLR